MAGKTGHFFFFFYIYRVNEIKRTEIEERIFVGLVYQSIFICKKYRPLFAS